MLHRRSSGQDSRASHTPYSENITYIFVVPRINLSFYKKGNPVRHCRKRFPGNYHRNNNYYRPDFCSEQLIKIM